MRFEATSAPPEGWDAGLAAVGGTVFHCLRWARYRRATSAATPLFCSWFSDSDPRPAAFALGFERALSLPGRAGRLLRRLEFDSAPLGTGEGDLLAPLLAWCRSQRTLLDLRLGSFDARRSWGNVPLPHPAARIEFLAAPAAREQLLRRMREDKRRAVKRAEHAGLEVREGGRGDVDAFVDLYDQTIARLSGAKGVALETLDREAVAELVESGSGRLFLVWEGPDPVAACLFGTFGRSAFYLHNGAGARAFETGAVPLLILESLERLGAEGFDRLNLGGVGAAAVDPADRDHGLYIFKSSLGTAQSACEGGTVVLRPRLLSALSVARRVAVPRGRSAGR
ncbi:MAG TPA: GNAT family N-acetyltransferase [Gaiellaceae bacterium]|nr:GNAT family N-acetyltransferase [Gaiellaceae bacterium]